jgi:hypothetical protein
MPITHRFGCIIPAGGNPNNVTSTNWNDGHLRTLLPTAYSANGNIPPWSLIAGVANVELVEATGTITLTLPPATAIAGGFPGMNVRFINMGTGTITITDGGSFTYKLTTQGQTVHIYASSITGAWQVLTQAA